MSKPKVHTVYGSTSEGLGDILDAATRDEPVPTPAAAELVEEAIHAGPVLPASAGLPTVAGGGGGNDDLVEAVPPGPTPRESAENTIELLLAVVPAGDWQPDSEAERLELIAAVERVYAVRGWSLNLPPEAILVAVMGKYARKRFKRPNVQAKLGPWLARLPLIGKLMGAKDPEPEPSATWPAGQLPRMTAPAA